MRHSLIILVSASLLGIWAVPTVCAQRGRGREAPPTAQFVRPPTPPAPIVAVSSGLGAIQFTPVNYGVPAPQALTRQLRFDDDRTRAAALSAIGAPGQYLQRGHIPMPRSIDLQLAPFSDNDELDALLTVELDQHLVTAVLVPVDGNWRRVATLIFTTPFEDVANTPTTWVRTARSMVQKDRYRAIFHASAIFPDGRFVENEAQLRIKNDRAIITMSFESAARECRLDSAPASRPGPTAPAKPATQPSARHTCSIVQRWFQPDPADPSHRFELVTASGHISAKDAADPLANARTMLASHLRNFSCQPFAFVDAAQRYLPTANNGALLLTLTGASPRSAAASNPTMRLSRVLALPIVFSLLASAQAQPQAHRLTYAPGRSITLSLPAPLDITIAASGLKRPRFFAQSPDGRIFVTSMYDLADNTRGAVYILDGWNAQTRQFTHIIPYLTHLRNPNNLAFYNDEHHQTWLYLPLTDKLVRYKYNPGDVAPSSPPQVLTRYPDYGLNYKYGGWHLTRTVDVATLHGRTRIYVSTGSSCNYCRELEAQRASLTAMDPDGSHEEIVAAGLRNAVDLRFIPGVDGGALFATNMGDDHLGNKLPEDTFFELDSNAHPGPIAARVVPNYGWPTCYFANGQPVHDTTPLPGNPGPNDRNTAPRPPARDSVYGHQAGVAAAGTNLAAQVHNDTGLPDLGPVPTPLTDCRHVPLAYTTFAAHSSPLGLAYFAADNPTLHDTFLVALHGASHPSIGTGYRVVRFSPASRRPQDFITGFLTHDPAGRPLVHGRPCGLLRLGPDTFLLTDDYLGLIYYVSPRH